MGEKQKEQLRKCVYDYVCVCVCVCVCSCVLETGELILKQAVCSESRACVRVGAYVCAVAMRSTF